MSLPLSLQRVNWILLWILGGPRLAHTGFGKWKPWVECEPNDLKVLLSFANGSAFTSAVLVTAGFSALFAGPGSINTNGLRWQLVTVSATALSAMATLHALLGFVRVTLYTKALQHVERFTELSKERKRALFDREHEPLSPVVPQSLGHSHRRSDYGQFPLDVSVEHTNHAHVQHLHASRRNKQAALASFAKHCHADPILDCSRDRCLCCHGQL